MTPWIVWVAWCAKMEWGGSETVLEQVNLNGIRQVNPIPVKGMTKQTHSR